jgi:class 3 adenylate cyclase
MSPGDPNNAWLENTETGKVAVQGTCSIGRASSNNVVLNDEKISRRHAAIHTQAIGEFWIIDLGSRNGVSLNGRRITQSTRLGDNDQIQIGPFRFTFRQPDAQRKPGVEATTVEKTVSDIRPMDCWLLVVDLESSSKLSQVLPPEELPKVTGRWFEQCKDIVEKSGGGIDKHLGDGFLAYWNSGDHTTDSVAKVLLQLKELRSNGQLPFRTVLHFGRVFSGGTAASGVERFFGPEINYVFKMERLGSQLRVPCIISQFARQRLTANDYTDLGQHEVAGFDGRFSFYSL